MDNAKDMKQKMKSNRGMKTLIGENWLMVYDRVEVERMYGKYEGGWMCESYRIEIEEEAAGGI